MIELHCIEELARFRRASEERDLAHREMLRAARAARDAGRLRWLAAALRRLAALLDPRPMPELASFSLGEPRFSRD